jgi:1-acyl-sn-glycerol-3-phosphate acyltransferase
MSESHQESGAPSRQVWYDTPIGLLMVFTGLIVTALGVAAVILAALLTGNPRFGFWYQRCVWGPSLCWLSRSHVTRTQDEPIDWRQPHVLVMNHQSLLDIPFAISQIGAPLQFVAKSGLFAIPFLGWYLRWSGMIPVDRGRSHKAIASLRRAIAQLQTGTNVFTFPEGTRTRDGHLQPLKKGAMILAIESGVPILPIAIEGTFRALPRGSLVARPAPIRMRIGKPIDTRQFTHDSRNELVQRVQAELDQLHRSIGGAGYAQPAI